MVQSLVRKSEDFCAHDVFLLIGASAGIGRAVAEVLSHRGASLILCARHSDRLEETAAACSRNAQDPRQFFSRLCLDLTDPHSPARLSAALAKPNTLGQNGLQDAAALDVADPSETSPPSCLLRGVLLNGGGPHGGTVAHLDPQSLEEAHALLFKGPVLHLQAALPYVTIGGSIVAITSTTVKEPHPSLTLSGCYRTALTSYLKSLSSALGPCQIRVNALAPGYVSTDQLEELLRHESERLQKTASEVSNMWAQKAALQRLARPVEIAKAVAFLFSEESSFITGQTLVADGGQVRATW